MFVLSVIGEKRTITLDPALAGMGGLSIETDGTTGQVKYQHTIIAGGVPVASIVTLKDDTQPDVESETSYLHVDRMGSVVMVTDTLGKMQTKTVFDTWGLRRSSRHAAVDDPFALALRHSATDRGYTQHQMLDDVGLIHMNARLYDPVLARFISADSVAPSPGFSQGLNRYSYVYNNPFGSTDPSGNNPWAILAFFLIAGGIATDNATLVQAGFALLGPGILTAAMGGFTAGWVTSGGDFNSAFRGAAFGIVSAGANLAAGGVFARGGFESIVLHGLVGGTISSLQGGSFKSGFRSGAISEGLMPKVSGKGGSDNLSTGARVGRAAAAASVGALAAHASGGDPATGAVTAAFGRLYGDRGRGGGSGGGGQSPENNADLSSAAHEEARIWSNLNADKEKLLLSYLKGGGVLDSSVDMLTQQISDQLLTFVIDGYSGQIVSENAEGKIILDVVMENTMTSTGEKVFGKIQAFTEFLGFVPFDQPGIQFRYLFTGDNKVDLTPVLRAFP